MKLKLDENGNVVVRDGKPVFVHEDGQEVPFDAPAAMAKISALNGEAKSHRLKSEELAARLKPFEGIEDLTEWRSRADKAMEMVENLKDKDLVEAGKVEEIKRGVEESWKAKLGETVKGFEKKLKEKDADLGAKDDHIRSLLVGNSFATSEFVREKTVLPPDIALATFGKHFEVREVGGELLAIGRTPNGEDIFSLKNPGELADPEEAIEILITRHYSQKDRIMKAGHSGSGAKGNQSSGDNRDLSGLPPIERLKACHEAGGQRR